MECNVGAMEGREDPEAGRLAFLRPVSLARAYVEVKKLMLISGRDQRHPGEDGGHVDTPQGLPA